MMLALLLSTAVSVGVLAEAGAHGSTGYGPLSVGGGVRLEIQSSRVSLSTEALYSPTDKALDEYGRTWKIYGRGHVAYRLSERWSLRMGGTWSHLTFQDLGGRTRSSIRPYPAVIYHASPRVTIGAGWISRGWDRDYSTQRGIASVDIRSRHAAVSVEVSWIHLRSMLKSARWDEWTASGPEATVVLRLGTRQ